MKLKGVGGMSKKVRIKGKTKAETLENLSIYGLAGSALLLSLGIGLTSFSSKGGIVFLSLLGSFLAFLFTVVLIFVWLYKELR